MNKAELIEAVAKEAELTKTAAADAIDAVIDTIMVEVAAGNGVVIAGFGSFQAVETKARTGRNPKTGEKIKIAAGRKVKFRAGLLFKQAVRTKKGKK